MTARGQIGNRDYVSLSINRNPYADVAYAIETTSDLSTWIPATVQVNTVEQLKARTSSPVGERTFLRVRFELIE